MAYSVVQKAISPDTTTPAATVVLTFGSAVVAGHNVAGACTWYKATGGGTAGVTVADDKGNSYTVIDAVTDSIGATQYTIGFYFIGVPAGGPTVITVTPPIGHDGFARAEGIEVSGAGAIDVHTALLTQNISSTTVSSGNITPTQTGDFLYGYALATTFPTPQTISVGTGYTIENNNSGAVSMALADEVQFPYNSVSAIAATFIAGATGASFDFVVGIIAFKAAAVAEGYGTQIFRVKRSPWR